MKSIILSIIVLFLIASCTHTEINSESKKTIITGQISNFTKVSEHDFIEFIFRDLLADQITFTEYIDKNGRFRFEPEIDHPTDFYLKYSGLQTYYISPGDSIHFEIDGNCWGKISETYTEEYEYYKVSGTSEKMNNDVATFTAFFLDSVNNWKFEDSILRISTPPEYQEYLAQQTMERLEIIKIFNQKYNTCKQFQEWVSLKFKFTEWDDLMRYRWLRPMYDKKNMDEFTASIPKEYFGFLKEWDKENRSFLKCKDYLSFLHEYSMYVNQLIPQDTQIIYRTLVKENYEKSVKLTVRLRYYNEIEKGFIKDVLISKYYFMLLDAKYYAQIKNIFDASIIEDEKLKNRIQKKFDYEKNLYENPQFAEGSKLNKLTSENDFLQAIIKKYPEKVIYLDFWAPWCSPCMSEMPHAKKIKKQFEGKDVVFVYLANRCEEAAWKTTIAEKKIEGEHYHLTDKQYSELSGIFGISGIPHYSLIDKSGNVVFEKAPRPGSGEELINLINNYLK